MDTDKSCVVSSLSSEGVEVEVQKASTPIADKFAGIASNLELKAEDVRGERLGLKLLTD